MQARTAFHLSPRTRLFLTLLEHEQGLETDIFTNPAWNGDSKLRVFNYDGELSVVTLNPKGELTQSIEQFKEIMTDHFQGLYEDLLQLGVITKQGNQLESEVPRNIWICSEDDKGPLLMLFSDEEILGTIRLKPEAMEKYKART